MVVRDRFRKFIIPFLWVLLLVVPASAYLTGPENENGASSKKTCEEALSTEELRGQFNRALDPESGDDDTSVLRGMWNRMVSFGADVVEAATSAGNQKVIHIRMSGIKGLSEELIGMALTEEFLGYIEERVHFHLNISGDGAYGKVIASNYKSFFIRSDLDAEQFQLGVFSDIVSDLKLWFTKYAIPSNKVRSSQDFSVSDWHDYIDLNFGFALGKNKVSSALNYNLTELARSENSPVLTIDTWTEFLKIARRRLYPLFEAHNAKGGLHWRITLQKVRRMIRDGYPEDVVAEWLSGELVGSNFDYILHKSELDPSYVQYQSSLHVAEAVVKYQKYVAQAEFLPVFTGIRGETDFSNFSEMSDDEFARLPWTFRREYALEKAQGAGWVFAFDGVGIGAFVLRDLDSWVADGAKVKDLESSLSSTGKILKKSHAHILDAIRSLLSKDKRKAVRRYDSGDDGLIFIPELTPDEKQAIVHLLEEFNPSQKEKMTFNLNGEKVNVSYRFSKLTPVGGPGRKALLDAIDSARRDLK